MAKYVKPTRCNPHGLLSSRGNKCEFPFIISIPERPYISGVYTPLGLHPFIHVDRLRTKIDGLDFTIMEYRSKGYHYIDTEYFSSINYQNYVPPNVFLDNHYYTITCRAVNEGGVSNISNKYVLNLLPNGRPIQKIICDSVIICDLPITC